MSRDSLSAARTGRVRNVAMLALILTLAGSCENPTKPPTQPPPATGSVRFGVTFATTPLALASIVVTLTSSGLPTVTIDLTPISGTDSRQWTGGPVTVTAATYAVDIQGRDASGVVTYRGSGSITVGANQTRTFAFALVCVSSQCQPASGTVSVFVLAPELETEPNDVPSTATPLAVVSLLDGQLQMWAASGAIDPAGDVDYFSLPFSPVFSPGDTIVVQVYGQRFGSTVDAVATLFDPFGNLLAQADNVEGADPVIKIPAFFSFVAGPVLVSVSGVGGSTGRYTLWAYACRSGGTHSVSCLDPSWAPAPGLTPDYTLSLAPAALTIAPEATGNTTVTITRTNFADAVTLSLGNAPTGVTGSFNPAAPTGTSSTLTVSVGAAVAPGVYNLTVDGTGSAGNRSTPLTLTVSAGTGGTLINGQSHSGTISAPGELHTWTFTAAQGDYIALSIGEVAPVSVDFTPWIRLVSPTGALLARSEAHV